MGEIALVVFYYSIIRVTNFLLVFFTYFLRIFACFLKRSTYIDSDLRKKSGKTKNFQKGIFWVLYALGMSFVVFL